MALKDYCFPHGCGYGVHSTISHGKVDILWGHFLLFVFWVDVYSKTKVEWAVCTYLLLMKHRQKPILTCSSELLCPCLSSESCCCCSLWPILNTITLLWLIYMKKLSRNIINKQRNTCHVITEIIGCCVWLNLDASSQCWQGHFQVSQSVSQGVSQHTPPRTSA